MGAFWDPIDVERIPAWVFSVRGREQSAYAKDPARQGEEFLVFESLSIPQKILKSGGTTLIMTPIIINIHGAI